MRKYPTIVVLQLITDSIVYVLPVTSELQEMHAQATHAYPILSQLVSLV